MLVLYRSTPCLTPVSSNGAKPFTGEVGQLIACDGIAVPNTCLPSPVGPQHKRNRRQGHVNGLSIPRSQNACAQPKPAPQIVGHPACRRIDYQAEIWSTTTTANIGGCTGADVGN